MEEKINIIKKNYEDYQKELLSNGKLPLKDTGIGFWAISIVDDLFELFNKINLKSYNHLIDLGSGDGRVVSVAQIFTKASGIEYDKELYNDSLDIIKKNNLKSTIYNEDYMNHSLKNYDIIFINPDKNIIEIEAKIKSEFKGTLIVYGDNFLPYTLKKKESFIANSTNVHVYEL
jgi:hypothetical protein